MALASLFGGFALANAGLGAVHGFAAPIGGMFPAPHGAVCAALLPHVMQANLIALHERAPRAETVRRYDEVSRLLTDSERAGAAEGVAWVEHLCKHLRTPPLRRYGITAGDFPALVEKAASASSMKANPIALTAGELKEILERAL
jgi:alcohol dehydrogenase class IV